MQLLEVSRCQWWWLLRLRPLLAAALCLSRACVVLPATARVQENKDKNSKTIRLHVRARRLGEGALMATYWHRQ
eukprot:COSAG02_NODE_28215_length_593_cov_5.872470_1_plen_73_part_10